MKIFTLLLVTILLNLSTQAQDTIPNPGMESWVNHGTYFDPTNWTTLNPLTAGVGATTCTQSTNDVHSGTYAVKLTTKSLGNIFVPAILTTGQIDIQTQNVVGGIPISSRPAALTGWYKYTPASVDTASLEIHLYQAQTEIGTGVMRSSGTGGSWSAFTIPVTYTTSATPDTVRILFNSSATDTPHVNSALLLDDLSYSNTTGITENEIQQVNLFPNPANGKVMIDNISMQATNARLLSYDGKLVKNFSLTESLNTIDISGIASGFYFINAEGKNGTRFRSKLIIN